MLYPSIAFNPAIERLNKFALKLPLLALALFIACVSLNPVGFIGGDSDDLQYLEAARCWLENGACLPQSHWQGRWPIVASLSAVISVLGEARWTIAIPSLVASLACLILVHDLGCRLFGSAEGRMAATLLAIAPVFALQSLDPNVDSIELAFILGGFAALVRSGGAKNNLWPLLCGLSFGLALQTRETGLAIAPVALIAFAKLHPINRSFRPWLIAGAALLLPFVIEAIVFAIQTGDPFWRRRLSISHAELSTTELKGRSRVSGLPFFNRELIENWRHEPGLSVHWAIDGLLNLGVNPRTAGLFVLLPFLWALGRPFVTIRERRLILLLLVAAALHAAIIVYVFAIDPKPRMMLPALAVVAIALGPLFCSLQRERTLFTSGLLVALILISAANILSGYRSDRADEITRSWIQEHGVRIETARQTYRRLIFQPDAKILAPMTSDRPLLLVQVNNSCSNWLEEMNIRRSWLQIERSASLGSYPATLVAEQAHLCLFRYADRRADAALRRVLGEREWSF